MKYKNRTADWIKYLVSVCALCLTSACVWAVDQKEADAAFAQYSHYLIENALAYEHGEGVPRDQDLAIRLYCEAARLGNAEAMYALGWMYTNGRGVERNDQYANTLFSMAAFLGHTQAAYLSQRTGVYTGAVPECLHTPEELLTPFFPVEAYINTLQPARQEIARLLVRLAPEYGIEPRLALAIALAESNLNPQALSPKNAMGVMQLIAETATRFNVGDPWAAEQNIRGGLAYLRWLLAYFQGDVALVAAGYNAGEGAVTRYQGVPPYPETRLYVERILEFFGARHHVYDKTIVGPSPMLLPVDEPTAEPVEKETSP